MELLLWYAVVQGLLGAFDMFYHHEFKEKLPWRKTASKEMILHGIRNFFYSIIFISLGWIAWQGVYAWIFAAIIVIEVLITIYDFVEEDRTRKLPESERITHTILTINYGAIIMLLVPVIMDWGRMETGFYIMNHGLLSWLMTIYALGVFIWGWRDLLRGLKLNKKSPEIEEVLSSLTKNNQNILVSGGTGFVGKRLCQHLIDDGHKVIVLTRNIKRAGDMFDGRITFIDSLEKISDDEKIDVIVNLAGEKVAQRWTKKAKKDIRDSRIDMAKNMYVLVSRLNTKPELFVQASAIGYYGIDNNSEFTEYSDPVKDNSFAQLICAELEDEINKMKSLDVRICILRIGLVIEKDGGALYELLVPFDCYAGGPMGNGKQYWSWIHRDDVANMVIHMVNNKNTEGIFNATAPNFVTNKIFVKELGTAMHRLAILPMPSFIVKLLFGKMGDDVMMHGQKVVPKRTTESGYNFLYPELNQAFKAIFRD